MARIKNLGLAFFFFTPAWAFATADSPMVQGMGGAGRAGVPSEALFTNPASAALLTQSASFFYYSMPKIPQFNAGGRDWSIGAYDNGSEMAKGSFGYFRTSRARVRRDGTQGYEDRSEMRFAMAAPIFGNVVAGISPRYVTRRTGGNSEKFFDGNAGAIFPVYAGLSAGMTYENVVNRSGETPPTMGAGLAYNFGYGIQAFADGYRVMKGTTKGDRGWALGAELSMVADFKFRAGRFQDGYRRLKGYSAGLGWNGGKTTLEYAYRITGDRIKEKDHILGMTVGF